jgi:hypothetical protein
MKLPNGEAAIVDLRKIREYCLSEEHPRGKHKARLFDMALNMRSADAERLRDALLQAAKLRDASVGVADEYGARYIIDFELEHNGRTANVRSGWIVRSGEDVPRFLTCYVL